jgi:hypothetical protein
VNDEQGQRWSREQVRKNAQMLLTGAAEFPERKLLQAVIDEWAHLRGSSGSDPLALEVFAILAWAWEELDEQERFRCSMLGQKPK